MLRITETSHDVHGAKSDVTQSAPAIARWWALISVHRDLGVSLLVVDLNALHFNHHQAGIYSLDFSV